MQKEKLLGLFKSGIDASLGSLIDISPTKVDDQAVKEETLLKIEKLRSLAPANITEDLANIATALCNNVYNGNRKNAHVHMVMMIDSIFDLAEYWENASSGTRKQPPLSMNMLDPVTASNSLTLSNIYGEGSDVVCGGSYTEIVHSNHDGVRKTRQHSLSFGTGELPHHSGSVSSTAQHQQQSLTHLEESTEDVQWKDHDQLEIEELQEKIQRLERQVKLDSESLVKSKLKCMDYELLCEENQRLQRTILELEYKLQQNKENSSLELQFSKLEMKSLHQRILEITSELEETRKGFQDSSLVTSTQMEDNSQMKQQNEQLELNNSILEGQVKTLFEEKEDLRRTITTLEEELHAIHLSKSQLENEMIQLQKLLLNKEKHEAMLMSSLQQRAIVDAQYKQMEVNQQHQMKVIEELKSNVRSKEKELASMFAKIDLSERQVTVLQTELNAMRDSYEENKQLAESLTSRITVLESEYETLQNEKEDLMLEMESIRNDLALERMNSQILKDDLLEISKDKVRLEQEVYALERDLDDIQRQVEYEHEQNQALKAAGYIQPPSSLSSNASAKAAAVINMLKIGASVVSNTALGGLSEASMTDTDLPIPPSESSEPTNTGSMTAPTPTIEAASSTQLLGSADKASPVDGVAPQKEVTENQRSSSPELRATSPLPLASYSNEFSPPIPPMSVSVSSPTPAQVYNGPPPTEVSGGPSSSGKASSRFKFSLPSAPQLNINKLQLPSSLSGKSSASSNNSSPVPNSVAGTGSTEVKKNSDGFAALASSSSRLLSFGKKKKSNTETLENSQKAETKAGDAADEVDTNGGRSQKVVEYDSYEDNDSDSDDKEDVLNKPFRPTEHKKKVFADYSYD